MTYKPTKNEIEAIQRIIDPLHQRILQADEYIRNGLSYKNALSEVEVEQAIKLLAGTIRDQQSAKRQKTKKVQGTNLVSK